MLFFYKLHYSDYMDKLPIMIKVFIFDFDDTLYYNVNWKEWNDFKLNYYLQHIAHVKNTTFKNSLENGEESDSSEMNISKILLEQGMRVDEWTKVRDTELLSFIKRQSPIVVPEVELKKFAKHGTCYIVTNTAEQNLKDFAEYMHINLSMFRGIYSNQAIRLTLTDKTKLYQRILDETRVLPNEVLVIGNSEKLDLLPARKLGMRTCLCTNGFTYASVLNDLVKES